MADNGNLIKDYAITLDSTIKDLGIATNNQPADSLTNADYVLGLANSYLLR